MKKILFIANHLGGGGAERVITILANMFKAKGHDVKVVSLNHDERSYHYGVDVPVLEALADSKIGQITELRKVIKKVKPDTVIAFEYHIAMKTVIAASGMKCKVIASERNDPHELEGQFVKKHLRNFLYGCADTLVCQTDDAKAYFSKRIQKKSVVIMNPIKDNLPKWDAENHNRTIVNFCRLSKQKNIPLLLEAFQQFHEKYPDYSLAIYGDGPEEQNIRNLIHKLGLEGAVFLTPFAKNIHEIASKCAMFVSSSDYEGLSNSMLEAMAMGMPVVCTDCPIGGARMVIEDGENGMLVNCNDKRELATAMCKIVMNKELRDGISNRASRIRSNLSLENILKKWDELII